MESEFIHSHRRHEADDVTVVHFTGIKVSLDEETLTSIRDQLYALADATNQPRLLLDFSNVDYISSMGLAMLLTFHKKLLASGRLLTIHNLTPQVHDVFKATRLDKFLHLWPGESPNQLPPQGRNGDSPIGVLVVDDDPAVRLVLKSWLGRKGFEVWTAAHGLEAVDLYRRYQDAIAVVLLDVIMPGMDGPHTLTALQQVNPNVQCCFMTGNPLPQISKPKTSSLVETPSENSGMWFRDKKNRRTACRETWDIQSSFLEVVSHGGSNNSQRQTIPVFRRPPQAPRSVSFPGPAGRSRTFRHCQCGLCQSTVQVDAG